MKPRYSVAAYLVLGSYLTGCALSDAIAGFFEASEEAAQNTADLAQTIDYVIGNAWIAAAGYFGGRGLEFGGVKGWRKFRGKVKAGTSSTVDAEPGPDRPA